VRQAGFDLNPGRYVGVSSNGVDPALAGGLPDAADAVVDLSNRVIDHCHRVIAAANGLAATWENVLERMTLAGRPGRLGQIARVGKAMIHPGDHPRRWFDLYSIPAFDRHGVPERVPGASIRSAKFLLSSRAVLVSKLNPLTHRVWPVEPVSEGSLCSTEFVVLEPCDERFFEYLYLYCISAEFRNHLIAHATGSTGSRQRVRVADLLAARLTIPSPEDASRMAEMVSPIRRRLQSIPVEWQTLSRLASGVSDVTRIRQGQHPAIRARRSASDSER
jgi:hypothetical protein